MDTARFCSELCRQRLPSISFCHDIKDERLGIFQIERAELEDKEAKERLREDCETQQIYKALHKKKNDQFAKRMQFKQLMEEEHELRDLDRFMNSAKSTKELVSQLKQEEEIIEQRLALAQEEALALRAEIRAWEAEQRRLEENKRLEGYRYRDVIVAQIELTKMKRAEEQNEKFHDRSLMRQKIQDWIKQERLDYEAALLEKQKLRQEIQKNIRQRKDFLNQQKAEDDRKYLLAYLQMEQLRSERVQQLQDKRKAALECRQALSMRLGTKNLKDQCAKEQHVMDNINWHVKERLRNIDLDLELANEKAQQRNRQLLQEYQRHFAEKEAQKARELTAKLETALQRKPLEPEEQDQLKQRVDSELQRYLRNKFHLEQSQLRSEKRGEKLQANRQLLDHNMEKQNKIQEVKQEVLSAAPIELLRYLPRSVFRSNFMPEPLVQRIQQQIRNDPIPLLTPKRHQPHMRVQLSERQHLENCCMKCNRTYKISNIF